MKQRRKTPKPVKRPAARTRRRPLIIPHLWYDTQAKEAAALYTSTFPRSRILRTSTIHNTPSGECDILSIALMGQEFMMINAGPYFKFNPSVSFLVVCTSEAEVDAYWKKLFDGGTALMELGSYPFSRRFGWLQDRFGLSWQLMAGSPKEGKPRIIPFIMYVGAMYGKVDEAVSLYTSVFPRSTVGDVLRYGKGEEPDKEGAVKRVAFKLGGQEFWAMESAHDHRFSFNEAISFIVRCETQKEIDHYWESLSAVPAAEQCGWLKDKYGLSWQVTPSVMDTMLGTKDPKKLDRVTQAFLKMKKFDLATLKKAYRGT